MTQLADWIGYGMNDRENMNKRMVRGWMTEARVHLPVIDRVKYPQTGRDRRISARVTIENASSTPGNSPGRF